MLSFEKCIYHQFYKSFDVLLVSRQSAIRKHHGCDTALKVKFNLDSKRFVGVISLDLRKTFDSLPLDLLLAKLGAYGLSSKSTGLMKSFLFERRQRVNTFDSFSDWSAVSRVPQVSILGPLLFDIFLNDFQFCVFFLNIIVYLLLFTFLLYPYIRYSTLHITQNTTLHYTVLHSTNTFLLLTYSRNDNNALDIGHLAQARKKNSFNYLRMEGL